MTGRLIAFLMLLFIVPACAQSDWQDDVRMAMSVTLPQKEMTLKDIVSELGKQTSSEFFVDRRFADEKIVLQVEGPTRVKPIMAAIEAATGMEWRMVGDFFYLCRDERGTAIIQWYERYDEARKAHLAGAAESHAREWLSDLMPFPPRIDPEWNLTPLQREQVALQQSLSVLTMVPPQLDWLSTALASREYSSGLDGIVEDNLDLTLKLNAAMVIHAQSGDYVVEMPLTRAKSASPATTPEPKVVKVEAPLPEPSKDEPKKPAPKVEIKGLWITDMDIAAMPDLLKKAKAQGFDCVLLPVLKAGHTVYPGKRLPQEPAFRGTDPLAAAIKTASEQGLKVYAVLDATLWSDADHPLPQAASSSLIRERNLLGRTYEEQELWQKAQFSVLDPYSPPGVPPTESAADKKVYLCPASSQVSRLLQEVAAEIATGYDVAGICLDGADYPQSTPFVVAGEDIAPSFGYTLEVRRDMIRAHQIDPIDLDPGSLRTEADVEAYSLWEKFRRGRLTGLVSEVSSAFKARRKDGVCCVTVGLGSDDQSPAYWSRLAALDALVPKLAISRPDQGAYTYSKSDADAVASLHRAVITSAAVVPSVTGLESDELSKQITALGGIMKLASTSGLRGYILAGDADTLSSALDAMGK